MFLWSIHCFYIKWPYKRIAAHTYVYLYIERSLMNYLLFGYILKRRTRLWWVLVRCEYVCIYQIVNKLKHIYNRVFFLLFLLQFRELTCFILWDCLNSGQYDVCFISAYIFIFVWSVRSFLFLYGYHSTNLSTNISFFSISKAIHIQLILNALHSF